MRYMTVKDILDYVDEIKQNSFSRKTKLIWLNELEYRVQTDVMLLAAESITYIPDDDTYTLLVPAPWSEIYYDYILMKLSEHLEESSEQNNRAATFDKAFTRFMRWWADTYRPANGNALFKGYYLKGEKGDPFVYEDFTAEQLAALKGPQGEDGAFRINVTYSEGVYSADKTFDEIKAAYDAGQQPYVVVTGGTLDLVYTLANFSVPDGIGHDFVDFKRYLIWEDTLKTETLRIYSYTTDSGSNIVKRTSSFAVPSGATYIAVAATNDAISTVNGETYADIQALIDAGKPVIVRYDDILDFYYFETFGFSDSSGIHRRLNFRCVMGSIVYTLTLKDDNTWVFSETGLQTSSITDTGGYFTTDTVEGALQEIGAEMALYSGSVVIEGTASDDMSAVTITTPDAWTLVSEAWNSEKRPLVVLRLSDDLCAYLTSVSTMTVDGQSQGMALFSLPPVRHLGSTPPYSIWLDESGGAAILPVESAVESVNGKTGAVVLNASDVGAQRALIAGSGIAIVEGENGDTIQFDFPVGNGEVSFVDVAGGAPIASFTLNQTQDCEINVNDLIRTPLLNNYRTAAAQDVIDAGKQDKLIAGEGITIAADGKKISASGKVSSVNGKTGAVTLNVEDIHYTNSSRTLDGTIDDLKRADALMEGNISKLQTADASLDSRITAIETGGTPVTLYIYWESVVSGGRVSLTKDGTTMSVADFISKMQSGAKIIISENNDTDSESSGFSNYRYKITDSTTASLAFDVSSSFNGSNRTIIISGSSSTNGLMTGYQDINHDALSDYSPLPEGSTPASKAWVEDYVDEKVAALQSKSIVDTGGYFTTDTVEGALQEIGAELADIVDGKADATDIPSLEGYATEAYVQNYHDNTKQDKITSTNKLAYSLISGTPTIPTVPTNVSTFTNDAGYLTLATLPKYEGVVE